MTYIWFLHGIGVTRLWYGQRCVGEPSHRCSHISRIPGHLLYNARETCFGGGPFTRAEAVLCGLVPDISIGVALV